MIAKALAKLALRDAFLAAVVSKHDIRETDEFPRAATDGKTLFINPMWWERLSSNQQVVVLAHEGLHVAFKHHLRRGGRESREWNLATDAAINSLLLDWPGFGGLDAVTPHNTYGKPARLSAEQYYRTPKVESKPEQKPEDGNQSKGEDKTPSGGSKPEKAQGEEGEGEEQEGTGDGEGQGAGGGKLAPADEPQKPHEQSLGEVLDAPEEDPDKAEEQWAADMVQAMSIAGGSGIGSIAGMVREMVDETLCAPPLNWKVILRQFILKRAKVQRSWERVSRRQAVQGRPNAPLMAGKGGRQAGRIVLLADTSGSMSRNSLTTLAQYLSELLSAVKFEELVVVEFDTQVNATHHFRNGDSIPGKWTWCGRGGTYIAPALEAASKLRPDVLLVYTDGGMTIPSKGPRVPTLWLLTRERSVPWGRAVVVK